MAALQPFSPHYESGQTVTVSTTPGSITLPSENLNILITNYGSGHAYVRIGEVSVTATAADFMIPAGQYRMITKADRATVLNHLGDATGSTLNIIAGEGWL